MDETENARRRRTARDAWLLQLTPEERGRLELEHQGEVFEASPAVLEAARGLSGPEPMRYTCFRDHEHLDHCLPGEVQEALQRSIERRQ